MIKFLVLMFVCSVSREILAQHKISDGGTINVCSGTFTDSDVATGAGGTTAGDYGSDEDYVFTICPGVAETDDVIKLVFNQFCVKNASGSDKSACEDILYLYHGDMAYYLGDAQHTATPPTLFDDSYCGTTNPVITATSPSGCLTFRFISTSNKEDCGWSADISCVTPCKNPTASLADVSPVSICPASAINPGNPLVLFDASGSLRGTYTSAAHNNSGDPKYIKIDEYIFNWGDGTSTNSSDGIETHTYSTPGIFKVSVSVNDNNTDIHSGGCVSTNAVIKDVAVTTTPSITEPAVVANCESNANLSAIGETRTVSESPPTTNAAVTPLPDGDGNSYTNSVDYGGYFPDGAVITPGCYPTVCFDLDHSYTGDLVIKLVAPSGEELLLFNRQGADYNFGDCTPPADDGVAGCPRTYCWQDGGATTIPLDAGTPCAGCPTGETGSYLVGGTYAPFGGNFNTLDGAELNGSWSLVITDNLNLDDGTLHNWNMTFPLSCYKSLSEISPIISSVTWDDTSPFTSTDGSSVNISPAPGDPCPVGATCDGTTVTATAQVYYGAGVAGGFNYDFTVEDEHACQYAGVATVTVSCPLSYDGVTLKGHNEDNVNILEWTELDSENTESYELERKNESSTWSTIYKTSLNGSAKYVYKDEGFSVGNNYYRVKIRFNSGDEDYSGTIAISNIRAEKKVKQAFNIYGQEVPLTQKGLLILLYEDGSIERKYIE